MTTGDGREEMSPVSRTAIGVARVRAHESARSDRLFEDPYAQAFVTAYGNGADDLTRTVPPEISPALQLHVVVRTRFYDDYLRAATSCHQVVVLGAGLDTRAFRLPWPTGTVVFELDLPQVLDFKARVLSRAGATPTCNRIPLAADLRDDWPAQLLAAGFNRAKSTAWLAEGLLIYLDEDVVERVLHDVVTLSCPGSQFCSEAPRARAVGGVAGGDAAVASAALTAMWKTGLATGSVDSLTRMGWSCEVHPLRELAEHYGRSGAETAQSAFLLASAPT